MDDPVARVEGTADAGGAVERPVVGICRRELDSRVPNGNVGINCYANWLTYPPWCIPQTHGQLLDLQVMPPEQLVDHIQALLGELGRQQREVGDTLLRRANDLVQQWNGLQVQGLRFGRGMLLLQRRFTDIWEALTQQPADAFGGPFDLANAIQERLVMGG